MFWIRTLLIGTALIGFAVLVHLLTSVENMPATGAAFPLLLLLCVPLLVILPLVTLWLLEWHLLRPLNHLSQAHQRSEQTAEALTALVDERNIPPGTAGVLLHSHNRMLRRLIDTQQQLRKEWFETVASNQELDGLKTHLQEQTADMEERMQQRTFELQVLYDLSQSFGYTSDYEELFRLMLQHLHRAMPHDVAASLLLKPEQRGIIFIHPTRSLTTATEQLLQSQLLDTLNLMRPITHATQVQTSYLKPVVFDQDAPPIETLQSVFQFPLVVGRTTIGLFLVAAEQADVFSEEQIGLVFRVASQAASSIQRLQALLEEHRKPFGHMLEHLPDGVLLLDTERQIVQANQRGLDYLGQLSQARSGEVLEQLGGYALEYFMQWETQERRAVRLESAEGQVFRVTLQPILEQQTAQGWLLHMRDISGHDEQAVDVHAMDADAAGGQRVVSLADYIIEHSPIQVGSTESADNLQVASQAEAALFEGLREEVRMPLHAILGLAESLYGGVYGALQEPQQARMAMLLQSSYYLLGLMNDMLYLKEVAEGSLALHVQPCAAAAVCEQSMQAVQAAARHKELPLALDCGAAEATVLADAESLQRVLVHFLQSVVAASPPGSRCGLRVQADAEQHTIRFIIWSSAGRLPATPGGSFSLAALNEDTLHQQHSRLALEWTLVWCLVELQQGSVVVQRNNEQGGQFIIVLPQP